MKMEEAYPPNYYRLQGATCPQTVVVNGYETTAFY
jgi:hypothetical protein